MSHEDAIGDCLKHVVGFCYIRFYVEGDEIIFLEMLIWLVRQYTKENLVLQSVFDRKKG